MVSASGPVHPNRKGRVPPTRPFVSPRKWRRSVHQFDDIAAVEQSGAAGVCDGAHVFDGGAARDPGQEVAGDRAVIAAAVLGSADDVEDRPASEAAEDLGA